MSQYLEQAHPPDPTQQDDDLVPIADSLLLRWVELSIQHPDWSRADRGALIADTLDYLVQQAEQGADE